MGEIAGNTFLEEVLTRRESFEQISERTAASMRRELLRIRRESTRILRRNLGPFTDLEGNLTSTGAARFAAQRTVDDVNDVLRRGLTGAEVKLGDARIRAFRRAGLDAEFSIEAGAGQTLKAGATTSQIFEEAAKQAASRPVLGIPANRQLRGILKRTAQKNKEIITGAVLNGEAIKDTAQKLKKAGDLNNAAAVRIARNNMNAVANDAHRAVYEANSDIFSGYKWDATFDNRTTPICARLHGTFYPLGSSPPGPPAHQNCRSVLVGVFKDPDVEEFAQAGERRVRKYNKAGEETGKELVSSNKRFEEWLRTQPNAVQRRVLESETKASLFRRGKIGLQDIVGDDLVIRSNRDVVRRALAFNPDDAPIQAMAGNLGVRPVSPQTIAREDARLTRAAEHTLGRREAGTNFRAQGDVLDLDDNEARLLRNAESRVSKTNKKVREITEQLAVEQDPVRVSRLLDQRRALNRKVVRDKVEVTRLRAKKSRGPSPSPVRPPPPQPTPRPGPDPIEPRPVDVEASKRKLRSVESTLSRNRGKIRTAEAVLNDPAKAGQHAKARAVLQKLNQKQDLLIQQRDTLKAFIRGTDVEKVKVTASKLDAKKKTDAVGRTARKAGKAKSFTPPKKYDRFNLHLDDITADEFAAIKSELDEILGLRKTLNAELKEVQAELKALRGRKDFSAKANRKRLTERRAGINKLKSEFFQKTGSAGEQQFVLNRGFEKEAGKTRLAIHRADVDMRKLGLDPDNLSLADRKTLRNRLREVNAAGGRSARKQTILNNIENQVSNQSQESARWWRANRTEIENYIDDFPDHLLSERHESIDWNIVNVRKRGFANQIDNSVNWSTFVERGETIHRPLEALEHEFLHHIEFRTGESLRDSSIRFSRAWRDFKASKAARFGEIRRGSGEMGFLDVFVDDYVGRDYGGGATEVMTMGGTWFFTPDNFKFSLLAQDPDHVKFIWALLNGFLKVRAL